jgi:iron complex outermembrane receptor protein
MLSYELGYRIRPIPQLSLDLALFYADYEHIGVSVPEPHNLFFEPTPFPPHAILPVRAQSQGSAWSKGVELGVQAELTDWWRIRAGYTYLDAHIPLDSYIGRKDPENQVFAHSMMDLGDDWRLDLVGRYVDSIDYRSLAGDDHVPAYVTADVRLAWSPTRHVEIAIAGRNLVEARHREFITQSLYASEITYVNGSFLEAKLSGKVNQKLLPWPRTLRTPISPPWALMASLQNVNPSPVECLNFRRSTWPNFVKIFS